MALEERRKSRQKRSFRTSFSREHKKEISAIRRRQASFLVAFCSLFALLIHILRPSVTFDPHVPGEGLLEKMHLRNSGEDNRPIMHTFYHRIDPEKMRKNTGMTDDADSDMINSWSRAWEAAGWRTQILTLEDAKKHPQFDYFNKTLHELPFDKTFQEYDILCFHRWLAMVEVGGGWMSDYDVYPLNPLRGKVLPFGGKLTAYENIPRGAVPSLVSGSSSEWNRMANTLIHNTITHRSNKNFWSDFFALIDVYQDNPKSYNIVDGVLPGKRVLTGTKWGKKECQMTEKKIAVHFSHDSIVMGVSREGETALDRPRIAEKFVEMWSDRCMNAPVFAKNLIMAKH
mmetsp:Transcript_13596/g.19002  ORF Transcript_13596/g.19002 Transcript_13596/m.19002 type:complete len:343 (-) Transcript_13596:135-1163(-)